MRDLRLGMEEFFQYLPVFLGQCHRDLKDVKGNVRLSEAIKGEHLHGTVPLYDLQEEVIGEFEIGCAMDVTGYSLEEAKEMVNLGERAGSVLSVEQTSLINGNFPKNVRGETYGTALMAEVVGKMPDLQAAIGTNDQEGYVRTSDLSHPKFETPQDALEWQKTQPDSYYIPLYDFQVNEFGSFLRERNNLTIAEMEAMKG